MSFIRNCRRIVKYLIKYPRKTYKFLSDFRVYNKSNNLKDFKASIKNLFICLNDWDDSAGSLGYYFFQDLWAAKKIFNKKPSQHFDIGSRVDGFIANVLTFMPVTMIDIRPLPDKIENLKFIQADATNLENISDNSIESLSSLCAPEHFGLGRYGDPVDAEACFKALKAMQRVLKIDGTLYIAVPVGEENGVAFNAHRIFKPEFILDILNELKPVDFSVISIAEPNQGFFEHLTMKKFHEINFGMNYTGSVVGLFEFMKLKQL